MDRAADSHVSPQGADGGQGRVTGGPQQHPDGIPTSHVSPRPHPREGASDLRSTHPDIDGLAAARSRRLLGVPVAMGPNITKFVYAQVPGESVDGDDIRDQAFDGRNGTAYEFDAEKAATLLCADLRKDEQEPPLCVASLSVDLASRWGRYAKVNWYYWAYISPMFVCTTHVRCVCRVFCTPPSSAFVLLR